MQQREGGGAVVAPDAHAEGTAQAPEHHEQRDHGREPPSRETPQRGPERDRQPRGREVERPLRDQDLDGEEQVRHRCVGDRDPGQSERRHVALAPPGEAEHHGPQRDHQHPEHQPRVPQRWDRGALVGRIVGAERQREHEQPGYVRQDGDRRETDRRPVLAVEHGRGVAGPSEPAEHGPAHPDVGRRQNGPTRDERRERAAPRDRPHAQEPAGGDEARHDGGVLLAEQSPRQRRGAPEHTVPLDCGVDSEQGEHRGHQLVPTHDVGHRLDVHRVDGEGQARHESGGIARPATRQHRHEHARADMPHEVHGMEPPRRADGPVQRVGRYGKGAINRGVEVGWKVRQRERPPHPGQAVHQRVGHDDRQIVQSEAVPQHAQVHDRRGGADSEIDTPSAHGAPRTPPARRARRARPRASGGRRPAARPAPRRNRCHGRRAGHE